MNRTEQENLAHEKVDMTISWRNYYNDLQYRCVLSKESDGVSLQIEGRGECIEDAFDQAYYKFFRIVDKGAPELTAPQIELKSVDDGKIPF